MLQDTRPASGMLRGVGLAHGTPRPGSRRPHVSLFMSSPFLVASPVSLSSLTNETSTITSRNTSKHTSTAANQLSTMPTTPLSPDAPAADAAPHEAADAPEPEQLTEPGTSSNAPPPPAYAAAVESDRDAKAKPELQTTVLELEPSSPSDTPGSPDLELAPPYAVSPELSRAEHDAAPGLVDKLSSMTIKEILAHLGGVFPMDEAVVEGESQQPSPLCRSSCPPKEPPQLTHLVAALPPGRTFVSVEHFGTSAWTITGRITAVGPDKSEEYYFVKIAYGETGRVMLGGEYESSKLIYKTMSDFIPEPFGYGKYHAPGTETYFYLSEFVDMDVTTPPEPTEFTRRLARLHQLSKSPTGKFGFAVQTCDGDRAHVVDWQDSWAVFYRKLFLGVCDLDLKRNGPWPEYELAINQVAWKVIPRLLDQLQADGRVLKPCIIHGDLWEGNMGINMETGDSLLFDAGSYFAHNEMELGHWYVPRAPFPDHVSITMILCNRRCEFSSVFRSEKYTKAYLNHYPAAHPAEEFNDRVRLYSLKGAINYSAGHPGSDLRKTCVVYDTRAS